MDLEKLVLPLEVAGTAFNAGVAAAAAGVTALIGTMGLAVKATFNWAAELDSIQDIIGGTNSEAAALNFTLRKSGVGTETFTRSLTILNKGLVKADGTLDTTGKGLQSWGITVKDANGNIKTQSQLISDISKKYNEFGTQQERVNFLTEVFGRGGAEMIDFFDTLANEGGIDAVTSKVERLGLVIDPGRYEQFTRSLEELKLVGLGLAVGFTEKVMPAFERFLEIVTGPGTLGQKIGTLAANFDAFVGNFIGNIGDSINNWVSGGGPEELSNKLISWIENIGTGDQSRILTAAQHLVTALGTALSNVDWTGIGFAIDTKISEALNSIDWTGSGESFGTAIDTFLTTGWDMGMNNFGQKVPLSVQSLLDGIDDFFQSAVGADDFGGWKAYFDAWGLQIETGWNGMVEKFKGMAVAGINLWWDAVIQTVENRVNFFRNLINSIPLVPNIPMLNIGNNAGASVGGGLNRASGGPVIAGQTYNVAEFYRPEKFTPSTNGRIDPMSSDGDMMGTLQIMLQQFADEISRSNRVAFEKVGRR